MTVNFADAVAACRLATVKNNSMSKAITANKILAHVDRILNDQRPITADVFLNNYCNNDCPYCAYRRWELDEKARHMKFNDFVQYASRLLELGVLGIILSGGGEPTVSKDFDKIIAWMDEKGIKWGINTNFNRYFEGKPQYLKVSLDAWDRDSYVLKRGVDAYETVRDNIKRFAANKGDTCLGIQLLAKSANDVLRFYDANKDLPVDYISIRPIESTDGRYYKHNHDAPGIINTVNVLAENDDRVILNYKWTMLDERQDTCTAQWSQIAVNEVGEVMYCCHKPYQIVGHLLDKDILEKKALAATDMKMCDVPCRLTAPNYEVARIQGVQQNAEFI